MSKSSSRSTSNSTSKVSSSYRPNPMTPKAGYTQARRRYGTGGKVNK